MNTRLLKKIVIILAALALVLAGAIYLREIAIIDEPTTSVNSTPPDRKRDCYDIDMTIDTNSSKITEDIELTVHNYSDSQWKEIVIRDYMAVPEMYGGSSALSEDEGISAVTLKNGEALSFAPDKNDASIVRIALDTPLEPKDSIVLKLAFSAAVSNSGDRCLFGNLSSGGDTSNDSTGSARTIELSQCFPIMAVYENGDWVCEPYFRSGECMYSRCADYDIDLSLPDGWVVAATGDEQQTENESNTDWHISAKNVRDMAIIASNELSVVSEKTGDITINSYYAGEGEKNRLQGEESLRIAKEAAAFYEKSFGVYPYGELDVVQSCNEVGGIEAPGIIRISHMFADNLGPDGGDADSHLLGNNVAHETAHQWFYGVVGNNQYKEAWLDEGFASAAALLYAKDSGWGQNYIDGEFELTQLLSDENGNKKCYIDKPYNELQDDYSLTVYRRAAEFLYRLSEAVGEEKFLKFMSNYYSDFLFKEATTSDFLKELEPYISSNDNAEKIVKENIEAAN